jgi:uroporphyrinogen decarboxylase
MTLREKGEVLDMKLSDLPKPSPDFRRLKNVLTGHEPPDRLPLVDLFADQPFKEELLGRATAPNFSVDPDDLLQWVDDEIEFRYTLGYDYIDICPLVYFGTGFQTAESSRRTWITESSSVISSREDFERHEWPDPSWVNYSQMEHAASRLPEGMLIIPRVSGVLENVSWLTGLEGLSYLLFDDPALVEEMFNRVGTVLLEVADTLVQMDCVGALFMGDDLGFRTGTLISPDHLRQYVFPWQQKIAGAAHRRDLPFILHSCGNIEKVMEDLIGTVGIDARHSFEDAILPVEQAAEMYCDRIAVLGGVDMDLLTAGSEEEVRTRVREIIARCRPTGRFALGTGNSIASYLRTENYLAMIDEARQT